MLLLVYLVSTFLAATADIITRNGNTLQIRFETANLNALEMGKNQIYTRLPYGNENIQVTCTKINCFENGTLQASINDISLSRYGQCQSWASSYQDDFKCIMQPFQSVLLTYDETQIYHVECKFAESELTEVVGFNLIRLFVDCIPRIKADGKVDKPGVLNIHYINREQVSCEASQDRNAPQGFDDIQWFTYDSNQNLNLPSSKENVTTLTTTYTNPFNPAYFIPQVQLYKCCTTMRGYIVRCQGVYLIDPTLTTTTQPTYTYPPETTEPPYTNPPYTNPPTTYTYPPTTTSTTTTTTTTSTTTTTTTTTVVTITTSAPCGSNPSNPCPTTSRPPTTRRHPCATCGASSTQINSLLFVLVNLCILALYRK